MAREHLGEAVLELSTDSTSLDTGVANARKKAQQLSKNFSRIGRRMNFILTLPLLGVGLAAARTAGQFEQLDVAFTTMLGDATKAQKLLDELARFAAETPFEFTEVAQAGKQLLAFGFAAEEIQETLRVLGNIAAGVSQPVKEIAQIFGEVRIANQLYARDLRQFTMRGIPAIQALADHFGVTEKAVLDMVSAGEVGFTDLQQALRNLASEGGRFGGMMEKQSKTLLGLFSTVKDELVLTAKTLGETVQGNLKEVLQRIIEFLGNLRTWIQENQALTLSLLKVAGVLAAGGPLLMGLGMLARAVMALISPFGAVLAIITVVGTAFIWLDQNIQAITERILSYKKILLPLLKGIQAISFGQPVLEARLAGIIAKLEALEPPAQGEFTEFKGVIESIQDAFQELLAMLLQGFPKTTKPVEDAGKALQDNLLRPLEKTGRIIEKIALADVPMVVEALSWVDLAVQRIGHNIRSFLSQAFIELADAGKRTAEQIHDAWHTMIRAVVAEIISNAIWFALAKIFAPKTVGDFLPALFGFAHGGMVTEPTLALLHGSPQNPEIIAPAQDFQAIASQLMANTRPLRLDLHLSLEGKVKGSDLLFLHESTQHRQQRRS